MAESGSWPSIMRHGLLSTSALLDLFGIVDDARSSIESERRPRSVKIDHPEHGEAVIRDQKPLNPTILERSLEDMSAANWVEALNGRVFFWTEEERLERLLSARAYRSQVHDVLTVDTESLVDAHEGEITLAHLNTGTTLFRAPRRGTGTFQRLADYPFETRGRVVELAVDYSVPDITDHTLLVESRQGAHTVRTLWTPGE